MDAFKSDRFKIQEVLIQERRTMEEINTMAEGGLLEIDAFSAAKTVGVSHLMTTASHFIKASYSRSRS